MLGVKCHRSLRVARHPPAPSQVLTQFASPASHNHNHIGAFVALLISATCAHLELLQPHGGQVEVGGAWGQDWQAGEHRLVVHGPARQGTGNVSLRLASQERDAQLGTYRAWSRRVGGAMPECAPPTPPAPAAPCWSTPTPPEPPPPPPPHLFPAGSLPRCPSSRARRRRWRLPLACGAARGTAGPQGCGPRGSRERVV